MKSNDCYDSYHKAMDSYHDSMNKAMDYGTSEGAKKRHSYGSSGWHEEQHGKKLQILRNMGGMRNIPPVHQPAHERDMRNLKHEIEEHRKHF